jgi:hypothetical protein
MTMFEVAQKELAMTRSALVLVAFAVCVSPCLAQAPDMNPPQGNYTDVTRWVAEVEEGRPDAALGTGRYLRLGIFDSLEEAQARTAEWSRRNPDSLRLTREREITVRHYLGRPRQNASVPAPSPESRAERIVPPARTPGLEGKTFSGSETLSGYGRLRFRFLANNQVEMIDARETVMGTWYRNGNAVHLSFFNGQCDYWGTVQGDRLSGRATSGAKSWTWSVSP